MTAIEELDHLFNLTPNQGIERYADGPAMSDRIAEWMETPEGTVADHPSWGHVLRPFRHEPTDPNLAVFIEMAIVEKLPKDVQDIKIVGIRVDVIEIDQIYVVILHQFGVYEGRVAK